MSLTLDDKQEKALREWWLISQRYLNRPNLKPYPGEWEQSAERLYRRIAPLMKMWSLIGVCGGPQNRIAGPDGLSIDCGHINNANGEAYALASHLCDMLNKNEALG